MPSVIGWHRDVRDVSDGRRRACSSARARETVPCQGLAIASRSRVSRQRARESEGTGNPIVGVERRRESAGLCYAMHTTVARFNSSPETSVALAFEQVVGE